MARYAAARYLLPGRETAQQETQHTQRASAQPCGGAEAETAHDMPVSAVSVSRGGIPLTARVFYRSAWYAFSQSEAAG